MLDLGKTHEFYALTGSRKGELTAWLLTILTVAALVVMRSSGWDTPWMGVVFAAFFVLASVLTSFGNWVERRTEIRLDDEGVSFGNGLREERLPWEEVRQVRVTAGKMGQRVEVIGENGYFSFKTLGELTWKGQVRERVGFEAGTAILETIVAAAGLKEQARRIADGYSYTRE